MQHAKKLVIVDPRLLDQIQVDREYKHIQRPADTLAKTSLKLDICRNLQDDSISEDVKAPQYQDALRRYKSVSNTIPQEIKTEPNPIQPPPPPPPQPLPRRRRRRSPVPPPSPPPIEYIPPPPLRRQSKRERRRPVPVFRGWITEVVVNGRRISRHRSPGSFGSIDKLRRYARKHRKDVVNYLKSQDAYTLHKPIRRRFIRRRTYSKGIGDLYLIDLADVTNLSSYNDGYRYLLNCIEKCVVIAAKIKEWSRSDRGIRTDPRRTTM